MSQPLEVGSGSKLVASALFLGEGALFVSIMGPAAITFGSGWPPGPRDIDNTSDHTWHFSVNASHLGPIGSEVPTWTIYASATIVLIGVGPHSNFPEALLTCAIIASL